MAGYTGGTPYKGVAPALDTLLDQLNKRAPKRSKASDGALGNAAHAATVSFHNPNPAGIVQARDFTDDPANGLDCKWLAKALTQSGDPRILEIISNRMYWTPEHGWVPYYGSNPHDKHLHLSVRSDPKLYNSTAPWNLDNAPSEEDDMFSDDDRMLLRDVQARLRGDTNRNYDMLQSIEAMTADVSNRVRGGHPAMDSLQVIQWQVSQLAAAAPSGVDADKLAAALVAAIPDGIAEQVAQKLADRLAA